MCLDVLKPSDLFILDFYFNRYLYIASEVADIYDSMYIFNIDTRARALVIFVL